MLLKKLHYYKRIGKFLKGNACFLRRRGFLFLNHVLIINRQVHLRYCKCPNYFAHYFFATKNNLLNGNNTLPLLCNG